MKVLALALLLTGCGGGASCEVNAQQMVQRLTELRGERIEWSDTLARAAQQHADDIARTGHPVHTGSDGSRPADRAPARRPRRQRPPPRHRTPDP